MVKTYQLGRVKEVKRGVDGLVRAVVLNYKLPQGKRYRTVDRSIHGIAVIVPIEEQIYDDRGMDNHVHQLANADAAELSCYSY